MSKQKRNYGVKDMLEWKFEDINQIPQEWIDHLGNISQGFRMIIHGKSGHGKTEYVLQLCKMFAMYYGKVNLNNVEQGRSKTIKEAAIRNNLQEIPAGKFSFCDPTQRVFDTWFKRLSGKNQGRFIVLDSLDYMKLTLEQFKLMHEKFKHKNIIIVAWDDPMDANAKKIRYMCDIKVKVHNFKAKIVSRFGGNKTWNIWKDHHNANYDEKVKEQVKLGENSFESEYVEDDVTILEGNETGAPESQATKLQEVTSC
jgi:ABC-type oligopeptide transport system ATPase subunit